jgi:beta-glucosidase
VSGMLTTALCSARQGWWNERRTDDRSYVAAIGNIVRANTLAMRAILETRPDAVFVQWECAEPFHRDSPGARPPLAERSLVLDLNYGRRVPPSLSAFLMDNGMSRAEYRFFLRQDDLRRHCVLASDWHVADERPIGHDSAARACFARYGVPLMHIGTGLGEEPDGGEPERRLRSQWSGTMRLRQVGVPMHGFAWPSLTDRVDWDSALREASGRADGRGLCDLDRCIRPAGRACQRLIAGRGEAPLREDASSTLSLAAA